MTSKALWSLPHVADLSDCLRKVPNDWTYIQGLLNDLMECVWDAIWTAEAYTTLESLRQRVVFGGETQGWADQDALAFFHLA
jgi:hypothetical protein